jgi:hypothetical protein
MPIDTGDFRLMSRRAVAAVLQLREHHRFMKGLFAWIGFRQVACRYERDPRFAGDSKFNYWRLWNFLASLEFFARRTDVIHDRALEDRDVRGDLHRGLRSALRNGDNCWHAGLGQSGGWIPVIVGGDAVPWRSAADDAWNHRRIPRPRVQRGKTAPTLLRSGILAVSSTEPVRPAIPNHLPTAERSGPRK